MTMSSQDAPSQDADSRNAGRPDIWLRVLIAGAALVTVTFGIRQVFGLFVVPMSDALGSGVQLVALAIAVQNLVWGFSSPLFGALADRIGAWKVAILGGAIYTAGLLASAFFVTTSGLFLGQMLIGLGLGSAGISIAIGAVGRVVPPGRRSLAFGLVTSFGSFGQFALLPVTQMLMSAHGWQTALLLLSFLTAAAMAMALGLRGAPTAKSADVAELTTAEALRVAAGSRDYLLLTAGFFVCGLQLVFITTHLPAFLGDRSVPPHIASWALALVGLFNIVGAFFCGWLGGHVSKRKALATVYLLRGLVICGFLLLPVTPVSALIFGAAMGLLWLGTIPLTSGLIVVFFGPKHLSMLYGLVFASHQIGSFLGSWLGGVLYDITGNHDLMWWLNVAAALFAFAVNVMIREQPVANPQAVTA
ncbi:MAG: MFS transporter [Rhodobiaceae bacterium]|jgi:predicted MFS family arabinose efflux permease